MTEHVKIAGAVTGIAYPTTRDQLVARATTVLRALPDQPYADLAAVETAARAQP